MNILSTVALAGPNVWSRLPVLEVRADLAEWPQQAPDAREELEQQLRTGLPCFPFRSAGEHATIANAATQRWAAQLWLDVALTLHAVTRRPLSFGQVSETDVTQTYLLVLEYEEAALARACLELARELCLAAATHAAVDVAACLKRLRDLADDVCLDVTTRAIVAAARQRDIPVRRLDAGSLVQLGHGARQRRFDSNVIDATGMVAESISLDKELTKALLTEVGVPTPQGRAIQDRDDAWRAALEIGLPVVVKPQNGDYQLGIGLNLRTREDILAAYDEARRHRDEVIVEKFVAGSQYRVTVVGNRVVAAIRRVSPEVVGDGVHTVTELIAEANRTDPRRGDDESYLLDPIRPDDDTNGFLAEQGLTLESVPPAGTVVVLSRLAHAVFGGEVRDVTDDLHPSVAAQCVRAARLLDIDVAGLDLVTNDIRRPLEETGGVVLEVNAGPCIALHFPPFCDRPRPVCEAIVEHLYPPGENGRIPTLVIAGGGDREAVGRCLQDLLQGWGPRVGRTSGDGLHVAGQHIKTGDSANVLGARALLLCPDVDLAILEQSWDTIHAQGLCIDRCTVGVLTGLAGQTGGEPGAKQAPLLELPTDESLVGSSTSAASASQGCCSGSSTAARDAAVLLDAIEPQGCLVIDAESLASLPDNAALPRRLVVVAAEAEPAPSDRRREATDRCDMAFRGHDIVLRVPSCAEQTLPLPPQLPVPAAMSPGARRALLHAVAAAWAVGVPWDKLRAKLAVLSEILAFHAPAPHAKQASPPFAVLCTFRDE